MLHQSKYVVVVTTINRLHVCKDTSGGLWTVGKAIRQRESDDSHFQRLKGMVMQLRQDALGASAQL